MLSIIISSYKPDYFSALEKNIAETCGILYEIIRIDNIGIMGTCRAYNIGAEKAKFNQLLFLHEDIRFETNNWGSKLLVHSNVNNAGVIGIAGGTYVPFVPSGWFTNHYHAQINIIQQNNKISEKIQTFTEVKKKVLAMDGVFISIKKEIFEKYKFDENLKGYHGYDTDFSLRIAKKHQNYVVSDIVIEHFSAGNADKNWFESNLYIRNKLGSHFNHSIDKNLEYQLYEKFVQQYFRYFPKNLKHLFIVLRYFPIFKIGKRKYLKLLKFTFAEFHE